MASTVNNFKGINVGISCGTSIEIIFVVLKKDLEQLALKHSEQEALYPYKVLF